MRKLAALSAALLATACGQQLDPAAIRAALPSAEVVKIDAPNPTGGAAAMPPGLQGRQAAVASAGGPAPFAVTSYLFATAVNSGVFWTLAPIAWLTQVVPPTSCTDAACTWGPFSGEQDLNSWMLVVTRSGDAYDYALSGAPKSPAGSPFVPVLSGRAFPGVVEHRGHGTFTVDFDEVWAGLAHPAGEVQQDFGSLTVAYDARTSLHLDVSFLGGRNNELPGADPAAPNRVNAVYAFDASAVGGDLQLGFRPLPPYLDGVVEQTTSLHTRWDATGAGRGDFLATRPGDTVVGFSQCWDGPPAYTMIFDGSSQTLTDPSGCAFPSAAPITITVP